ncbi:hypothetical protein AXF42_Ash021264 [Apostasia shenzhenica]|uniref:Uncharacterized protein n=1 Tax=Apostasia shenzhenica TaxID=1088818 RepID=A0A2H9ZTN5_9ASPA|nr:hypothetical protein AXF42_Ash021264 [Apostasia shenzhenica]
MDAKEVESKAKQMAFKTHRRYEQLKSEIHFMRVLIDNGMGWRGRRMEDLEEVVRTAVNIISTSAVGHHVKSRAAFDVLLQTLVDVSILNQENIRGPSVLLFCGPKGLNRFFNSRSHGSGEIPPTGAYAGWGYQLASPRRGSNEGQSTPKI